VAIAGQPDILGEERPIFSNEIARKLTEAGIAVDNSWVVRVGAGLTLSHLVVSRPHMTGDLGRTSYTITPRQTAGGLRSMSKMPEDAGDRP
jgi:hypothetical protein